MTGEIADYIMAGTLVNIIIIIICAVNLLLIKSKLSKQERLMEYIYARALKAKKLEEHREKLEDERLSKLKKARAGTKK